MTFLSRLLHGWAGLIRLPRNLNSPMKLLLAVASLIALAGLLAWAVTAGARWLPARFWQLIALCAIALAVLWWFLFGARRFSRRGLARKHIGDLAPGDAQQDQAALAGMQAAVRQARQTILRSPAIDKGRDPLYRIPWVLFIGADGARVDALLRAASGVSPFPAPPGATARSADEAASGAAPLWQWWFFKSMIAIEAAPLFVCDPQDRRERGLWHHALQQLSQERDKLPLNGIAVCIDAATLLGGPGAVKPVAIRLRRLVDEALEHLQVQLPVYLIVTGLEQLHGYAAFRAALPADALPQALGHCLPEEATIDAATITHLDELFDPIAERLHALRLTALRGQQAPAGRRGVFDFVEQIRNLRGGLQALVQLMLEDNPFQRTPRWRGLYFTAADGDPGGQGGGAFTSDLFTRFLPADQPLATTRMKGHAARMGLAGIGVAAMLGLSALVSHGLKNAHQDDGTLLAQTRTACREPSDAGAGSRIAWVARCGQTVEKLEAAQENTGLGFGLRQADKSIAQTKDMLLRDFSNLILAPYDQVIESDLARGQATVEHVMAVSQRLRLLAHCRTRNEACDTAELARNTAFDPHARVFSPFLSGEQDGGSRRHHAAALFTTYLGYLRWQSPSVLDAEAQRLQTVLAQLLSRNPPSVEQLKQWADARHDPVRLRDFWLPASRVVGTDDQNQAQVPPAFTLRTWRDYVQPMLETAAEANAGHGPALQALRGDYLRAYMQAWGRFNGRFAEGLALWQGDYGDLARLAAGQDNPYLKLDRALQEQLLSLPLALPVGTYWSQAWSRVRNDWLGAWRPLGGFVGDAAAALANPLTSPWWTEPREAPAAWVPAWLASRAELDTEDVRNAYARGYLELTRSSDGADLYQAMAQLYRHAGAPGSPPPANGLARDYAMLLEATEKPPEKHAGQFSGDDLKAWRITQGPPHLLLFLSMRQTGAYLQGRWRESVYAPLQGLDAAQQQERLYGPNGRLAAFAQDWLAPFVTEAERAPRSLAGVQLPLSPAFADLIAAGKRFDPDSRSRPFPAAHLQFQGPSRFGNLPEGAAGSQVEVLCQDRSFSANSQGESLADGRVLVYWAPQTCSEVRLRIALPDPPDAAPAADGAAPPPASAAAPLRLTLLYQGADSFPTLIRQFRGGSRAFRLAEFQSSYTPAQWAQLAPRLQQAGLTQIRVFLRAMPTPDMERHLAGNQQRQILPDTILDL